MNVGPTELLIIVVIPFMLMQRAQSAVVEGR